MGNNGTKNWINPSVNRRTFLQVSGALASVAMASDVFAQSRVAEGTPLVTGEFPPDPLEIEPDILYTVCQMCHSRCGVRAKLKDGILVKLDGNPYHPNNRDVDENNDPDRLTYSEDPADAVTELGRMCLKGQAGVQTVYDPFRIQHPLKRVGPRNSGQWQAISWQQAFSEIAAQIDQLIPPGERDELIDPARPELGAKRNQLAFAPGRSVEKELSERVWKHGWGTVNYGLSHTSVCESTRHVANELITWDPGGSNTSMGGGRTEGWQIDILGAEYIILFGANPLEADFPMVGMARNLMQFKRNGGRYVSVDPRFNKTAAQAHQWVPIEPGTDAALAMGMIRWILEHNAHDLQYLENPNETAAAADDEPTWTDSTYLVGTFTDSGGRQFQRYLKAVDLGMLWVESTGVEEDDYLVWSGGRLRSYREVDRADLEVSRTLPIGGANIEVKSAFTLLKESALSKTLSEYSTICDVPVATIESLASEFVGHGKKAVAMTYRGPIKHTNGLYNQLAIQHLNTLIGNYDWEGGCTAGGGGWNHKSGVVDLGHVDNGPTAQGIRIDRAKTFYTPQEAGSLFTGFPAPRAWFPFGTHGNYQEVIPSIADGYPYPIKVLITYWNAWPYSVPALRAIWEQTVSDENKLPLLVAISPVIGEVAAWADYILPDTVYLEKFAVPGIPWRVNKGTAFQRPVVGKFDGQEIGNVNELGNQIPVNATNDYEPFLPDTKAVLDIQIGLAKALGLPGVGFGALSVDPDNPLGQYHSGNLNNGWDWAKAILLNIVNSARTKHPNLTIEEIISKGGVFDNPGDEYDPPVAGGSRHLAYKYGNIIRTFIDPIAQTRDSVTGEYYSGVAHYRPIAHSDGTALSDPGYPFRLITYKTVHHGQARTNVNPWLMLIIPENPVEISALDAEDLKVETGDQVVVKSPSNPQGIVGRVKVTQGLKPGVVAISHHYGHWEQHSRPVVIAGTTMPHDPSRGAGLQPTQIMRTDNQYPNTSLQEPLGASCSFYDTWVEVEKLDD